MSALQDAKKAQVAEIKANIEKAKSFVLVDYKTLTVGQDTSLRSEYRANGVKYHVYKNRLMKIALNELGYNQFDDALNGPTAIAMGYEDELAPARISFKKADEFKKMSIKCGLVDGKYMDDAQCKVLATLPGKTGLVSQVLGLLQAPVAGLARVLAAIAEKQA